MSEDSLTIKFTESGLHILRVAYVLSYVLMLLKDKISFYLLTVFTLLQILASMVGTPNVHMSAITKKLIL